MQAHSDVVLVRPAQGGIDDLRVRAPVLVDLESARAGLDLLDVYTDGEGLFALSLAGPGA
jgi:hypothetical protein